MTNVSAAGLDECLRKAGIDLSRISASGGGVWLFGSRAVGCARLDSDWDLLVLTSSPLPEIRQKIDNIDIIYGSIADLETWASSELAAHVEDFGIRLDAGLPIKINSDPVAAAARKHALIAKRSRFLDRIWVALRPDQLRCELLRLRRNAHRGWVLASGHGVPPTALLDQAWSAASEQLRAAILTSSDLAPRVCDALLDEVSRRTH